MIHDGPRQFRVLRILVMAHHRVSAKFHHTRMPAGNSSHSGISMCGKSVEGAEVAQRLPGLGVKSSVDCGEMGLERNLVIAVSFDMPLSAVMASNSASPVVTSIRM